MVLAAELLSPMTRWQTARSNMLSADKEILFIQATRDTILPKLFQYGGIREYTAQRSFLCLAPFMKKKQARRNHWQGC